MYIMYKFANKIINLAMVMYKTLSEDNLIYLH